MLARSVSRFLIASAAAILLLQDVNHGVQASGVTERAPGSEKPTEAPASPAEEAAGEGTPVESAKKSKTLGHPLHPFNLGISIPYFFNMRLLTGPAGTGLGLNVPALLNFQLDAAHRRRRPPGAGLLLNLFGNRGLTLFNRRRRPVQPTLGPTEPHPIIVPGSDIDNAIDIKRKPSQKSS
ncbi:uncharacterized protein LOC144180480 [Haemaphysalis longicornis]